MSWDKDISKMAAKFFEEMKILIDANLFDKSLISQLQQHNKETTNEVSQDGRHRQSSPTFRSGTAQQPSNAGPPQPSKYTFITFVNPEPQSAIAIEEAGIRAGEVIAHRAWWALNNRLFSVHMTDFEWDPKIPMEGEPKSRNGLGVHAFKTREEALAYRESIINWYGEGNIKNYVPSIVSLGATLVTGTVALWGEIIEHERGYRAEFARPVSIDVTPKQLYTNYRFELLIDRYGVKANVRTGS